MPFHSDRPHAVQERPRQERPQSTRGIAAAALTEADQEQRRLKKAIERLLLHESRRSGLVA
jgi:hypothetical protein